MDSLDLAGVIGTWVAVALALIALIGILPIYIGYRRKLSAWAEEVWKIDDPNQDFVTRGWPGMFGQRLFRRVHIPNLLDPPNIHRIRIVRTNCTKFWPRNSQSGTGWVNFLNILRSYDALNLDPRSGGQLEMVDGELVLPIHRSWVLLLGLVDRYSRRQDHGLLSGESREPQVGLRFDSSALSGLSGVMSLATSDEDEELGSEQDIICFHMHRLSQTRRLSSEAADGDYSLQHLLFLFLGYIPAPDGHLYLSELPSKTDYYRSRDQDEGKEIWDLTKAENHMLSQDHKELFEELGMNVQNVHMLKSRKPSEEEEKLFSGQAEEYYDLSSGTTGSFLIRRTHANAILRAAMSLECNPQNFLYARGFDKKDHGLMFSVLGRKGLKASIQRALHGLDGHNQRNLETEMKETLTTLSKFRKIGSWSRGLCAKLSKLHTAVVHSFSEEQHSHMLAIGVLFTLDSGFRKLLKSFDTKPVMERRQSSLTLDFPTKAIRFHTPEGTGDQSFPFDFAEFFRDPRRNQSTEYTSRRPETVPYANFATACLRSHIIMAMWSMCISSHDLSDLYTNLEPTVYVSARTLPRRKRSALNRNYYPERYILNDDESGDWSGEKSSEEERRSKGEKSKTRRDEGSHVEEQDAKEDNEGLEG